MSSARPIELGRSRGSSFVHRRALAHEHLRESSFRSFIREHAPQFRLLEPLAAFENARFAYEATLDLLQRYPALAGLYVAGGGADGVIQAVREQGDPKRVVVVCNELVTETRAALTDGIVDLVISTPVMDLAAGVVRAMLAQLDGHQKVPRETVLRFDIYVSENV